MPHVQSKLTLIPSQPERSPSMIKCALKLPDENWLKWLDPIQRVRRILHIETDAVTVTVPENVELIEKHGLDCLCVRDIITPELADFIVNRETNAFDDIKNKLFNAMLCAESAATELFTMQLRLDANSNYNPEKCLNLIHKLLDAPMETRPAIALQARQPEPFPASREWDRTTELCSLANSNNVGIYVHFHPDDYAETATIKQFIDENINVTKAICFHYDTRIGQTLFDDEQAEWAERLKDANYNGIVLFAPRAKDTDSLYHICRKIVSWMDLYSDN